jgi:hypothetical protein
MTKTSSSVNVVKSPTSRFRVNAIRRPSGDQAGSVVVSLDVTRSESAPSTPITQIAYQRLLGSRHP